MRHATRDARLRKQAVARQPGVTLTFARMVPAQNNRQGARPQRGAGRKLRLLRALRPQAMIDDQRMKFDIWIRSSKGVQKSQRISASRQPECETAIGQAGQLQPIRAISRCALRRASALASGNSCGKVAST